MTTELAILPAMARVDKVPRSILFRVMCAFFLLLCCGSVVCVALRSDDPRAGHPARYGESGKGAECISISCVRRFFCCVWREWTSLVTKYFLLLLLIFYLVFCFVSHLLYSFSSLFLVVPHLSLVSLQVKLGGMIYARYSNLMSKIDMKLVELLLKVLCLFFNDLICL
jgi:hypothetical protein